ncbi:MAG: DUF72 domain-containing protein [Oceanipulchritudo sp.]
MTQALSRSERLQIGTSGWNFDDWIGDFYRKGVRQEDMLPQYAETFGSVEVNGTFYNLPKKETVHKWVSATPDDFRFAVKASRYLTHMKKLKDPDEGIANFFDSMKPFGAKLGPVLFQLPPNWNCNLERLRNFLESLPGEHQYTFEFRDKDWLRDETYDLLSEHGAALCFYHYKGFLSPFKVTGDFIYLRLHGPSEEAYKGSYPDKDLEQFADEADAWLNEGMSVHVYFDNDEKAYAPNDARRFREMLGDRA